MKRTKNTDKNRLKHGLATVFLFYYSFDRLLMSQFLVLRKSCRWIMAFVSSFARAPSSLVE